MIIDFGSIMHDVYGKVEQPVLVLKTLDGRIISPIANYFGLNCTFYFNDVSKIEFSLPAYHDGVSVTNYDKVVGMKIINVEPYGDFILVNPVITDEGGKKEVKKCTAYSLEYAFNYKRAEIPAGTYNFYNPVDNENCIMQMIVEFMPDWSIGDVDRELIGRWRTFDNVDDSLYSFMMNTLQESYNCLFLFDTYNKKINVMSVNTDVKSVPIHLSYNNLVKSVEITEKSDEIVTALSGYGSGDEVNIRSVNPNGSNTIYNLDYFIGNGDLPDSMVARWTEYNDTIRTYKDVFSNFNVLYIQKVNEEALAKAKAYVLKSEYDALNTAYLTAQTQAGENAEYDEEIARLKEELEKKQAELDTQNAHIEMLKKDIEKINDQINAVVDICKLSKFFSSEELNILSQYFVEDSITEDTFIIPEYSSAILGSASNTLDVHNQGKVKIVGSEIYASNIAEIFEPDENGYYPSTSTDPESGEETMPDGSLSVFEGLELPKDIAETIAGQLNDAAKRKTYEFRGGVFEFTKVVSEIKDEKETFKTVSLKGDIVNVDFHYNYNNLDSYVDENSDDMTKMGYFTLTATLRNAVYDGTSFPNMNVSISGMILKETPFIGDDFLAFDIENAIFYSTASTTEYQKQAVIQELYDHVETSLAKLSVPSYEFSVDSANFIFAKEFQPFKDQLKLGSTIFLALNDEDEEVEMIKPIFIELSLNYDDEASFSMVFSNKYRLSSSEFELADIITDATHTSRSVSLNKASYSAYKDSQAGNQIENLTNNNLDVARNNIINSSNQGIEWNESGLFLRKLLPNGKFHGEQIGLINNLIAMTDDSWDSVKLAIGHFTDKNIGDTWGIVAPNITGTLLAGNNLVIENTVLDESGLEVVKQFKVDGSGAFLNNASFCLSQEPNPTTGYPGGKILIDPKYGIAMGNIDMFTLDGTTVRPTFKDEEGNIIWDEDKVVETEDGSIYYVPQNTKFFFDIDTGNAYFGGTISGENIVVNTLNGNAIKDLTIDAGSKLTGDVNAEQIYQNVIEAINKYVKFSDESGKPIVSIDTAVIKDLTADNFVGGTITADSITTNGLSANVIEAINAAIGKIDADKIDVDLLDANRIILDSNNGKFIIDPLFGLAAGNSELFVVDEDGNVHPSFLDENGGLIIDDETKVPINASLYFDINSGKTYFAGEISASQITSGKVSSDYLDVKDGFIKNAMIENLSAGKIVGGDITADVMQSNVIKAINAYMGTAVINTAKIGDLDASKITSGTIDAELIGVINLNANNITAGLLSSDYMQIKNGFIKNAMIESIAADKILSGSIFTNRVNVQSEDGGFNIIGNTAQWYDANGKIRLQAGRDAGNNFTFAVFGEDGTTTYFDETGLKSAGVPDGIIVNDMVSDNASISAGKLDISSLFDVINEDGSHTINTSKIFFDDKAQSLEVYLSSIETAAGDALDAANSNSKDLADFSKSVTDALDGLQGQIDGTIMTWFYEYVPTNENIPAVEWTSVDDKNNHLGDLFYDTITGYCYRWQVLNNEYSWQRITDVDVTKALADAAKAQDTADSKRRIFRTLDSPTPPYDEGDLWVQGTTGEIMVCKISKAENQSYSLADWEKASKYTDDTLAQTAITQLQVEQGKISSLIQNVETIDGVLDSTKTLAEQTANKFTWIVSSGDSESNFTLTDKFASLVSDKLNIQALVEFKTAAETGSKTVIHGGSIDTDTLSAGSIAIGKNLLEYLFSTEEEIEYDDDGTILGSSIVGQIPKLEESYEQAQSNLNDLSENIIGEILVDEDGNPILNENGEVQYVGGVNNELQDINDKLLDVDEDILNYTKETADSLDEIFKVLGQTPTREEIKESLNLISQNNNAILNQYGSFFKYIEADPLRGLVIHGIDPVLDESGNVQYHEKQVYEYVFSEETGNYIYQPKLDADGKPVMEPDKTNPICNISPYSVNINNSSFVIKKNDDSVVTITDTTMKIPNVNVVDTTRIGDYIYRPLTNSENVKILNFFYEPL